MERFKVIFNDVPMPKPHIHAKQLYMPKVVGFEVEHMKDLYEQIDKYILRTNIKFLNYEIHLA